MDTLVFGQYAAGRMLLQRLLQERGHGVVATDDLTAAKAVYDGHRASMVFLSGIDGASLELAKFVRSLEGERAVIVGFIPESARTSMESAVAAGVDDTIVEWGEEHVLNMNLALAERRARRRDRWYELEKELRASELARQKTMKDVSRCRRELADTQRLAHVGTWHWHSDTEELSWTDEVFAILGFEPNAFEPSFDRFLQCVHPDDADHVAGRLTDARNGEGAVDTSFRIVRPDGEERSLYGRARLEKGVAATRNLVGIFQDVTELAATERALEAREKQFQAILETTVDGIIAIDEQGIIQSFNRAAEEIFGYAAKQVIGSNVKILMPEYYAAEHDSYIRSYLETGHRKIIGIGREVVGKRKDGSTFPMDLAVSEVQIGGRQYFSGIVRDVSERRQLEQQILRISEQERQRIGQDLHDGLGQMLTGIGLIVKNIGNRLERKGLPEAVEMREITDLMGEADEYARSLARGLIPVELDAGGISSAFHRLATNARKLFDLDCSFEEIGTTPEIENVIATHLYRIAQEGLSNAVRHGQASQVRIILANGQEQLRLRLTDNGRGIPDRLDEKHSGMGIRIMRYRARIIGATLEIRKRPQGGTVVVCTLPTTAAPQVEN